MNATEKAALKKQLEDYAAEMRGNLTAVDRVIRSLDQQAPHPELLPAQPSRGNGHSTTKSARLRKAVEVALDSFDAAFTVKQVIDRVKGTTDGKDYNANTLGAIVWKWAHEEPKKIRVLEPGKGAEAR